MKLFTLANNYPIISPEALLINLNEKTLINFNNKSGIYCLYNKINNKFYIGSAINIFNRISSHTF